MHDPLSVEVLERASAGDPVALCQAMVGTDSVNPVLAPGGAGERAVAELVSEWLEAWGLNPEMVEVAPGRFNVVGTLKGEGPTLMLNGHLDTVGVDGMTIPPFAATLDGDRLLGRGSCDMKGGDAAILAAVAQLAKGGPRPPLVVAFTADEEHASLGMDHLVASGLHADLAVVCEPTSLAVMPAHKGFVWLRALFTGRTSHGSRPEIGIDAIRHAGLFLAELDPYSAELRTRPGHPLLGYGSFHAGTIVGGTAESVYPESCELLLERRTVPGEEPEAVVLEFQAVLGALLERHPDVHASLEMTLSRPGTEVPESSKLVQGLLDAARERGVEPRVEGMTAWVDAAFLNEAGVPAVCFGPGDIAQAHTEGEWIDVRQIRTCAEVLETFARALAV